MFLVLFYNLQNIHLYGGPLVPFKTKKNILAMQQTPVHRNTFINGHNMYCVLGTVQGYRAIMSAVLLVLNPSSVDLHPGNGLFEYRATLSVKVTDTEKLLRDGQSRRD